MLGRRYITIIAAVLIMLNCNQKQITLQPVRNLPGEFYEDKHFGSDLRSVYERNEFLLVTGGPDQTGHAFITVHNTNIDLHLDSSRTTGNENFELYSGSGYQLILTYTEYKQTERLAITFRGKLIVQQNALKSVYEVVGIPGYHLIDVDNNCS
jgi:hypothetical protein